MIFGMGVRLVKLSFRVTLLQQLRTTKTQINWNILKHQVNMEPPHRTRSCHWNDDFQLHFHDFSDASNCWGQCLEAGCYTHVSWLQVDGFRPWFGVGRKSFFGSTALRKRGVVMIWLMGFVKKIPQRWRMGCSIHKVETHSEPFWSCQALELFPTCCSASWFKKGGSRMASRAEQPRLNNLSL